jgi:hypothetical protein
MDKKILKEVQNVTATSRPRLAAASFGVAFLHHHGRYF